MQEGAVGSLLDPLERLRGAPRIRRPAMEDLYRPLVRSWNDGAAVGVAAPGRR